MISMFIPRVGFSNWAMNRRKLLTSRKKKTHLCHNQLKKYNQKHEILSNIIYRLSWRLFTTLARQTACYDMLTDQ